jgi:enoyl-CoA hydratase
MTGRTVPAPEAEQIGLITKCIPKEELEEYVLTYAQGINKKSPVAMRLAKALKKVSERVDLDTAYEYENELISLCFDSEDTKKRLKEFIKPKRK